MTMINDYLPFEIIKEYIYIFEIFVEILHEIDDIKLAEIVTLIVQTRHDKQNSKEFSKNPKFSGYLVLSL